MTSEGIKYLSTNGLAIGYSHGKNTFRLFDNLNLSLTGGVMICFMGPNGAGKSSLLRTLAGLQKPLHGTITLHQAAGFKTAAAQIAVVLTDRVHALNLTAQEIVTFGRYPYLGWNIRLTDADRKIIHEAIEQVHLGPLLNKRLFELSDGQLQMVMIARALAQDTPVILLDEPTAHLDLNNRVEIMNLLLRLSRETGKAILLATHELDLALQTADRIWLTGKHQNILTGLPEDLVLNGSFDEIFELKGFDLKTGRVQHQPFRRIAVQLLGEGPEFLWTKNALERNGFGIWPEEAPISIVLGKNSFPLRWLVKINGVQSEANSIESVIKLLIQTIASERS
jgi:iron complex transport system ATP-binding protein